MFKVQSAPNTHYSYWVSGTLLSLASIAVGNYEVEQYAAMGIVTLLFFWGAVVAERCEAALVPAAQRVAS